MSGIVVGPEEGPVIELAPLVVRFDLSVEEIIAGLPMNHPDITDSCPSLRRR